jgi:hypothetical protein
MALVARLANVVRREAGAGTPNLAYSYGRISGWKRHPFWKKDIAENAGRRQCHDNSAKFSAFQMTLPVLARFLIYDIPLLG